MVNTLHSSHHKIFLDKLRKLRESRSLRQADLALLLGRSQSTVSHVESGNTRLDIIGLRDWLEALDYGFLRFLKELDGELRRVDALRLRPKAGKARKQPAQPDLSRVIRLFQGVPLTEE
ncbi:MAG: helix-turn-helix transcriptional regulator [Burkholderiales bacterium]|nr:helix-turn-helix transcriptional regulator [Burkholderiales bacterium]